MVRTSFRSRARVTRLLRALRALYPHPRTSLRYRTPWQLLVAVVLSARTTDKKVNEVTARLFRAYKTAKAVARTNPDAFARAIREVNYYKTKARHLVAAARTIERGYRGIVPVSLSELIELPGVGMKTANVVIAERGVAPVGIVVDTHVARLACRWGLTQERLPVRIEQDLMRLLPRTEWRNFPLRCIAYGRQHCPARSHDHAVCPLARFDARP